MMSSPEVHSNSCQTLMKHLTRVSTICKRTVSRSHREDRISFFAEISVQIAGGGVCVNIWQKEGWRKEITWVKKNSGGVITCPKARTICTKRKKSGFHSHSSRPPLKGERPDQARPGWISRLKLGGAWHVTFYHK